jgi:nicotinamidase-related amidase
MSDPKFPACTHLPIPPRVDPDRVGEVWRVPYEAIAEAAIQWRSQQNLSSSTKDEFRVNLLLIDVQNTFCIPEFELFVSGRSGSGAVDDNRRLCEFVYHNLGNITQISATMDTHHAIQIFHALFLVDRDGRHPSPYELITADQVRSGHWRFNPAVAGSLGVDPAYGQEILLDYAQNLRRAGKYDLTIWPYHAMLGGIGHALVSAVEEAIFFHTIARDSQPVFILKGDKPFTEHYSAMGPEIKVGPRGEALGGKNQDILDLVWESDALIIAGQAKSHCVAWTISDILDEVREKDRTIAEKIYLLDDCTSPVVIPGVIDYTDEAEAAYSRFASAGMHLVRSTTPMADWPGLGDSRIDGSF